ncbi:MAG: helix-turn-helix transcriptional regulator [Patescibacteria group bacterium]
MKTALRTVRRASGVSQTWMAEQLGIHRMTYSNYELGKSRAPKSLLFHAAHLLHVPPDKLQCR